MADPNKVDVNAQFKDVVKEGPGATPTANVTVETKTKKLAKAITGSVIVITEGTSKKAVTFDLKNLNDTIKFNLSMHGLSQKLGDAAAAKSGDEALKSIQIVWDGLMKGDWTVRAPAGEKITKSAITEKLGALSPKEQEVAKALLLKLGLKL